MLSILKGIETALSVVCLNNFRGSVDKYKPDKW